MFKKEDGGRMQQSDIKASKNSWAEEVEQEHESIGWEGMPRESASGCSSHVAQAEEWRNKSKKKKKKKNGQMKDHLLATETENGRIKSLQNSYLVVDEIRSSHTGELEGGVERVLDSSQSSIGGNTCVSKDSLSPVLYHNHPAGEKVWKVAGTHNIWRNEDTQQNKNNGLSAPLVGWGKAGSTVNGVGMVASHGPRHGQSFTSQVKAVNSSHYKTGAQRQGWRSSEIGTGWTRRPENTGSGCYRPEEPTGMPAVDEKWETVTKNKGKGQRFWQKSGKTETHFSKNDDCGEKNLYSDDNWSASMLALQTGPVNGVKGRGTKMEIKSQSFQQLGNPQFIANHTETKSCPNPEQSSTNSSLMDSQVFSQLLPFEKQGEVSQLLHFSGSKRSCQREDVPDFEQAEISLVLDDLPSSVHSDNVCSDDEFDSDSSWVGSEDFDSDVSTVSHETRKRNKWFRHFFDTMNALTNDQINEPDRQWHCPACKGGVGGIFWYRGLQPLLAHAKAVRSKRIKPHRNLAEILEEELRRRCSGLGPSEEGMFGKWKGIREDDETKNPLIIWPPMVVIQNTKLQLDEQEKWIGMGNKELLDHFKDYQVMKARHAYGPQGHRGMSIIIFADSPTGYMDAHRLDQQFKDARRGRENWDHPGRIPIHPGGNRILYGYMATPEDMEIFNKHNHGKAKLKWATKRLHEAVLEPLRQMNEDNHQLHWLREKVQKQKEHSKALEKTVSLITNRLSLRDQEIKVIRTRALDQHEENQREMDYLEQTYKERMKQLANESIKREEEIEKKEEEFKKEQIQRCQQLEETCAKIPKNKKLGEDQHQQQSKIEEEITRQSKLVEISLKDSEDYEFQKRELMRKCHMRKKEFMRKQYEEALQMEREFEKERAELLERYRCQREAKSKVEGSLDDAVQK